MHFGELEGARELNSLDVGLGVLYRVLTLLHWISLILSFELEFRGTQLLGVHWLHFDGYQIDFGITRFMKSNQQKQGNPCTAFILGLLTILGLRDTLTFIATPASA